mmetsp:Transcript_7202/g.18781  ORF Transcript_7202/g.18781 Transcript_7202/m.18781 type:complete len:142 (+) Transcript_7202:1176-1601(+)
MCHPPPDVFWGVGHHKGHVLYVKVTISEGISPLRALPTGAEKEDRSVASEGLVEPGAQRKESFFWVPRTFHVVARIPIRTPRPRAVKENELILLLFVLIPPCFEEGEEVPDRTRLSGCEGLPLRVYKKDPMVPDVLHLDGL